MDLHFLHACNLDRNFVYSTPALFTLFSIIHSVAPAALSSVMGKILHVEGELCKQLPLLLKDWIESLPHFTHITIIGHANGTELLKEALTAYQYEEILFSTPEEARALINQKVSSIAEKAFDLFTAQISPQPSLITAVAAFFNGKSKTCFSHSSIILKKFHTKNGIKEIPMLHATGSFPTLYSRDYSVEILELPLEKEVSILFIRPDCEVIDCEAILRKCTVYEHIFKLLHDKRKKFERNSYKKITIPCLHLVNRLQQLEEIIGKEPADAVLQSDFTDTLLSGRTEVKISRVASEVHLQLYEGKVNPRSSIRVSLRSFTLKQPFDFLIIQDITKTILFGGRVRDPSITTA